MEINPHIFRGYDIRGVVDEDLNKETVEAIIKAYATFLQQRKIKQAVVGHDHRLTGPEYRDIAVKTLASYGIDVIDIGLAMTPVVYFAQYFFQSNGAVDITASHNPKNYNGFKLSTGYSETMVFDEIQNVRKLVEEDTFAKPEKNSGKIIKKDITKEYINDVTKRVSLGRKLKVVVDTGNGSAGAFVPEAIRQIGCEVIEENTEVDGNFPSGTPDPIDQEMLDRISERVLKEKADLGMAFDGDGDRIGVVDEKGRVLWNDVLMAIFSKEVLERIPGAKIVYNNLCSQIVKKTIEEGGGVPIMWLTGHSFIKEKISIEGALFGGELSGHFFFVDNFYGYDDACYAGLRILDYVSNGKKSLGDIFDSLPQYVSSPEIKIDCADDKKVGVIKKAGEQFKKDYKEAEISDETDIPNNDGVRADFKDGMMILRYSQNGPYITVKFEAQDDAIYEERKKYMRELLEQYDEIKWDGDLAVNLDAIK